jgi:hypothetical protein
MSLLKIWEDPIFLSEQAARMPQMKASVLLMADCQMLVRAGNILGMSFQGWDSLIGRW